MQYKKNKKVVIIGSGIGGLALACMLGKSGYEVVVLEKNSQTGGRARVFSEYGFRFDMGPSWYMMPDVFEHFFNIMDEKIEDYYKLKKLNPSYKVATKSDNKEYLFYSDIQKNKEIFESIEKGAGEKLVKFLKKTKFQYEIAYNNFMFKNYDSFFDFINFEVIKVGMTLPIFSTQKKIINKLFKSEILRKVMQYQTVLLGTAPGDTPGIYSLMNYVDFVLGEWYPEGGIRVIPESLEKIAIKYNVDIKLNCEVEKINIENNTARSVKLKDGQIINGDFIISNADIAYTDMNLLSEEFRVKNEKYWNSRKLAPSAFILYLGVKGKIDNLEHHNLLFSENWDQNFSQIFDKPQWPDDPSLYICMPSKIDKTVAPDGYENLFVLVPIASGLNYDENFTKKYEQKIINDIEKNCNIKDFKKRIIYKKIYTVKDFENDYNSFKGSALGLSHTLLQTAFFRPNNIHPKIKNLLYVGAGTNPGIGVPICLISAELAFKRIENIKDNKPLDKI